MHNPIYVWKFLSKTAQGSIQSPQGVMGTYISTISPFLIYLIPDPLSSKLVQQRKEKETETRWCRTSSQMSVIYNIIAFNFQPSIWFPLPFRIIIVVGMYLPTIDLGVPPKIPFGLMFLPNWICFGDVGFSSVRHKIVSWDLDKDESRVWNDDHHYSLPRIYNIIIGPDHLLHFTHEK